MDDEFCVQSTLKVSKPKTAADLRRIVDKLNARNVPDDATVIALGYSGRDGFQIYWRVSIGEDS